LIPLAQLFNPNKNIVANITFEKKEKFIIMSDNMLLATPLLVG